MAAEILSPRSLGKRVSRKALLPSGCHPERAIVESPVNNLALLSVLRAGRVRKFEKHISHGDRPKNPKSLRAIPDIQVLGQLKKMFWGNSNLLKSPVGTGPK
jgi:hypothetical protein